MKSDSQHRWRLLLALVLATATLAVYWPVHDFGFVDYDDQEYVRDNPHVRSGLSAANIRWAFTEVHSNNWHPLTWLSHMVDCTVFGLRPGAHHLVNVALHVVNTLLLFAWLQRLTGATWRSALVAGGFALHPAHVESVAWISERKDVLSTLLVLLALRAYTEIFRKPGRDPAAPPTLREAWPSLAFYVLSLLSKGMYVTLPGLLLLVDLWPLGRMNLNAPRGQWLGQLSRLLAEKWAWITLAFLASGATFWAQRTSGAVVQMAQLPLGDRAANAVVACVRYLGKLFWPVDLAVIYPLPPAWPAWQVVGAISILVVLTGGAFWLSRRHPFVPVGWFWFLGCLVPVIGLVQVGSQSMADRYTYFSYIGLFLILVWLGERLPRAGGLRPVAAALAAGSLLACGWGAHRQVGYWSSSQALFERAIAVTDHNAQAQRNLAALFDATGQVDRARQHYAEAVRLQPTNPEFRTSLGVLLARTGDTNAARPHLEMAMETYLAITRQRPDYAAGFNGIGIALAALGEHRDAVSAYERAVELAPRSALYRNNLGVARARTGDLPGAIAAHREALRLDPQNASAANNLGAELVAAGQVNEAVTFLQRAVALDPTSSEAHSNLGGALALAGDPAAALGHYDAALKLDANLARTHLNRGLALNKLGRADEAVASFEAAVRLEPASVEAHYNLGRALFLRGDFAAALGPLTATVERAPSHAAARGYRGRAWAATQQLALALPELRESLRLRPESVETRCALAWILATAEAEQFRDGAEAIRLLEPLESGAGPAAVVVLDTLAAAYAEAGRFEKALQTAERARALAQPGPLATGIGARLELYRANRPYRTTSFESR